MPIYEFYCPQNHRIYQFYARTLAQVNAIPKCPENPKYEMRKLLSSFSVSRSGSEWNKSVEEGAGKAEGEAPPDLGEAMGRMEREFAGADENDPRAMGRLMRRMAELTGEKLDGAMEHVVRKLEEGTDPESLDDEIEDEVHFENTDVLSSRRPASGLGSAPRRDPVLYEFT